MKGTGESPGIILEMEGGSKFCQRQSTLSLRIPVLKERRPEALESVTRREQKHSRDRVVLVT